MRNSFKRARARSVSACAIIFGATLLFSTPTFSNDAYVKFDIPAETTAQALNDFSKQSGFQILFPYDVATKTTAPEMRGRYSVREALVQILAGSGLEIASENGNTISLRVAPAKSIPTADRPADPIEVAVTGTRLRNTNPTSPVRTLTRKDIDASGYSQVGDLMRSLPENYSGGQNPGVIGASSGNIANQNMTNASSINLRGIGSDATLVLLNGHRLSGDSFYQGADISGIPLGALQRVDIVTDGTSALYGSDAVAGTVNFILRKDYNGAEVTARLGGASQGGAVEHTYDALVGQASDQGYALFSYEFSAQSGVIAAQRQFASNAPPAETLLQPQTRNSAFLSTGWALSDALKISFDGLFSDRDTSTLIQQRATDTKISRQTRTPSLNGALTAQYRLPSDWKLSVVASNAQSRNKFTDTRADGSAVATKFENAVTEFEATVDGTLFQAPGGDVKAAIGVGHRREHYNDGKAERVSRQVSYLFGETIVPLVRPSTERTGLHELELSLSGRSEDYNDFGRSQTPKIGLRFKPLNDLSLRATWGKSFKAPSFDQMYQQSLLYVYPAVWLGYGGAGNTLVTWGGNPDLKPEKSTSSTLGFDYAPSWARSTRTSLTYFTIDYSGRVVQPVANLAVAFTDPTYAPFVQLSPSASTQAAAIAGADQIYNYSGGPINASTIVAVIEDRYANASVQKINGVDFAFQDTVSLARGNLDIFLNASSLEIHQQTTTAAPSVKLSGTKFNAPDLKARGGATWTRGGLSMTGIINYLASETDTSTTPTSHISSWTTLDLNVAYRFTNENGVLKGVKVAISSSNLFDRDPPRATAPNFYSGLNYDSTNASILGRVVSLSLTKAW